MLDRVEHDNGLITYQSPALRSVGVIHGFTTRAGGVSKPPYDTLNLDTLAKGPGTDANTSVAENFRRVRAALGCERVPRFEIRQVHGADVWETPARPLPHREIPSADAVVSTRPGQLLAIRAADCVPVLLSSPDGRIVGAAHAGWRGVVAQVVPALVHRLYQDHGIPPRDLVAAIGPCISAEHFEVGSEVAVAVADVGLEQNIRRTGPRPHVDLRESVKQQLVHEGVLTQRIDVSDRCTYADEGEFFSHRRDVTHQGKPATGRMAAIIIGRA